ncbi:uncharacterized protein EAF01_008055 [Botrytis porri]|uniref:Uncharacterized protein n=1 Tax=Botrytis porri TaxID=87229 RepID=A0A4Z1KWH4_9HELO|nr:uncharacterized protein EAF01_008055 [Botrytis porri]KAF7898842.1 hypothetical protein EAF01_008055 [Botrytis porri]TGO88878.1 hypothetical protein BPOR_0136g00020 [Botrytis porri]
MEAFCQYRHTLGLPASVLNAALIEGVGFVAENGAARRKLKLKAQGHWFLDERALWNSFPVGLGRDEDGSGGAWVNKGHVVMGLLSEIPLDDPSNRATWKGDRRMGVYHNARSEKASQALSGSGKLREFLARVENQPDLLKEKSSKEFLVVQIGRKISSFILITEEDIDTSLNLIDAGLD